MSKPYYETTKVVKVVNKEKVVIRNPGIAGPKGDPGDVSTEQLNAAIAAIPNPVAMALVFGS